MEAEEVRLPHGQTSQKSSLHPILLTFVHFNSPNVLVFPSSLLLWCLRACIFQTLDFCGYSVVVMVAPDQHFQATEIHMLFLH